MPWPPGSAAVKIDIKGIHRVSQKLASGKVATYYYAWRGGPRIVDAETGKPLTDPADPAFRRAYDALKAPAPKAATVAHLITRYKASSEFTTKAESTRADYGRILDRIRDEFGDMPIRALSAPGARAEFKEWRDGMAKTPRTADLSWSVLARLFSVSKDSGLISVNPCERGGRLYRSERNDKIWTEDHLARLFAVCSAEVYDVVMLALWTGQRQSDLLKLSWSAYDGQYIRLRQGKRGARVSIPVGDTLREALAAIPRIDAVQILHSSLKRPWSKDGFKTSFGRACDLAGIKDLTFHDLRGTAVTRLALAQCTTQQIATITGHALETVNQILDAHYLSRDIRLAEQAMDKLERYQKEQSGTESVKRPVKRAIRPMKASKLSA